MATQAADLRSDRVVVLVSPAEKRRISEDAAAAAMSVSDFMRTAAQNHFAPTEVEAALLKDVLADLESANERTRASFEALEAQMERSRAWDEVAYKDKVRAELEARDDIDWDKVAEFLGFARIGQK